LIRSDRNLRPEPGYRARTASTVAELRTHRSQSSSGALLVLKCEKTGAWFYEADRPYKFGGRIARRERAGFPVVEAYWLPKGARRWRPISLEDVRKVYRLT
jgi:hypothetical protein